MKVNCENISLVLLIFRSTLLYLISFEPGFGAYQGLAQKIEVPFSRIFRLFLQFEGSRANSKPAPNLGAHQTPAETLSEYRRLARRDHPNHGKKGAESAGANANLLYRFPSIWGIAPGVAPRIEVIVLLKS